MSRMMFSPVPADAQHGLRRALDAAGLPTDDLGEPDRSFFELADADGPIGFVGLEGTDRDRLLRSLVVLPGRTRRGYGGRLVAHAEALAHQEGAERLHLLTTSAADFFQARGYTSADRAEAPSAVTGTAQFKTLCPGSAAYLVKDLA